MEESQSVALLEVLFCRCRFALTICHSIKKRRAEILGNCLTLFTADNPEMIILAIETFFNPFFASFFLL
jgi:hypothetical protein